MPKTRMITSATISGSLKYEMAKNATYAQHIIMEPNAKLVKSKML